MKKHGKQVKMQDGKPQNLTPELWEKYKKAIKYIKSGMYEQDHNTVLNGTREEALRELEALKTKNRATKQHK